MQCCLGVFIVGNVFFVLMAAPRRVATTAIDSKTAKLLDLEGSEKESWLFCPFYAFTPICNSLINHISPNKPTVSNSYVAYIIFWVCDINNTDRTKAINSTATWSFGDPPPRPAGVFYLCSVHCPVQHMSATEPWRSPQLWKYFLDPERISPAVQTTEHTNTPSGCIVVISSAYFLFVQYYLSSELYRLDVSEYWPFPREEVWVGCQ